MTWKWGGNIILFPPHFCSRERMMLISMLAVVFSVIVVHDFLWSGFLGRMACGVIRNYNC